MRLRKQITYEATWSDGTKRPAQTVAVKEERVDGDWTYFKCNDGSTLGIPTHWIKEQS